MFISLILLSGKTINLTESTILDMLVNVDLFHHEFNFYILKQFIPFVNNF